MIAIRVFITRWTEEASGGLVYIREPIDDYLANASLSAPVDSANYYARMSLANRPDRAYCIKVMRGGITQAEWDSLAARPGVWMVPPGVFDAPISSVKQAVRTKIYSALDAAGIPRTTFDSAATVGGFLRNLLTELGGEDTSFGPLELETAEWG